jgi:hypothetical protein
MPRDKIRLAYRPIGPFSNAIGVKTEGAPEIDEEGVLVIDGFCSWRVRPSEQNREAPAEWFYIVRRVPESIPDD